MRRKRDNSLGDGDYYAATDYAGPARRLIVVGVDVLLLLAHLPSRCSLC
ncbi:MAG: hypothetical protein H6822_15725 [Planctomycetaceae bacterium]|nr:hypothetical protein [Planctomycetales bacterium]MCB9923629.1 hypothetical protein [Planctomycetaceae bacterium]